MDAGSPRTLLWHVQDKLDPAGAERRATVRIRVAIARLAVASAKFGLASDYAAIEARALSKALAARLNEGRDG